jgi:hypothetical protein
MIQRSQRGAAKVSVIWLVGLIVAFLIALVMFFLTNQVATQAQEDLKAKSERVTALEAENKTRTEHILALSKVLGYYDEANASMSSLDAAQKAMADAAKAIPGADGKDFESLVKSAINANQAATERASALQGQVETAQNEKSQISSRMNEAIAAAEKEKNELRSQAQDAESRAKDQITDLERQLGEARENFKDRDSKVRALEQDIAVAAAGFDAEKMALQARMDEQGRKLNPFLKEPERADGKILAVSKNLDLGWINIGSTSRLSAGTRFRVVSGKSGSTTVKAWCEVTNVQGDMAEVRFYDQKDPLDAPVSGDVVYNPLFDPKGERAAILIGRFSGAGMNQTQLEALLAGMGIAVQKKLDKSTDFLIVGGEMYSDENGAPLESPMQPSDLPVYKDATAQGVQVVLLKDLRQYFAF